MKKSIRIVLIVMGSFLYLQSNAQSVALKAGFNLSNMLEKDDEDTYSDDFEMLPGFHAGLSVDVPFNDALSFEPGIMFTTKGMKYSDTFMGASLEAKATLYYIDIPLTLKAAAEIADGVKLYGVAGPYLGLGISGKMKATAEYMGEEETEEEDIEWGSDEDEDDLKRLEMGATFGAGLEFGSFLIGANYDLGLSNISSYQDGGATSKNRVLRFSVGYRF